ncbi:MAG: NUDIX domain-containing protein [Acidimicrobiia bacterium]|nr:NUDIX domain-containing protein [Acidimicrobiia bacterium]
MGGSSLSAGILLYRTTRGVLEVLIGHPGGPFWAKKQEGAWSIPKGLVEAGEDARKTALREFAEETGHPLPDTEAHPLGEVTLRSGKRVVAWAIRGDLDPGKASSNLVRMEWPRGSGRQIEFPEIDELRWCPMDEAQRLLNPAQVEFLKRLRKRLDHVK